MMYVPGDSERKLAKATEVTADVVIADLEDAVAAPRKDAARTIVSQALSADWQSNTERYVRINSVESEIWREDIAATIEASPDGYVIPKVDRPEDVRAVNDFLTELTGVPAGLPSLLVIVTESAIGYRNAAASMTAGDNVVDVLWGAEDLAANIGARATRDGAGRYLSPFDHVRAEILMQAKALGKRAIDAPYLRLGDEEGLRREAKEAADMGFDGKQAIHPDHIAVIHQAFRPANDEIDRATELIEAFEQSDDGTFAFDGEMVDPPHLKAARRIIARAGPAERPHQTGADD